MLFQEPKVEFIQVNLAIQASTPSTPSYETCTGPDAPSNVCSWNNVYWLDENGNQYEPT